MSVVRLLRTLRYLKPVQFYGRVLFRLSTPKVTQDRYLVRRKIYEPWVTSPAKRVSLLSRNSFSFLNQRHELKSSEDWNRKEWEKLWLYNLHYFDDLNSEKAETRRSWHFDLLERWVAENPVGHGNGWEPYPLSMRIVNWIKWALAGNQLPEGVLQSLAIQARYLRKRLEIHLLGNHLLANAKALIFAGSFFEGEEAEAWGQKGLKILSRELPEQILKDGGHFERSPMYHAIILEDMLDLLNISRAYGRTVPDNWIDITEKMLFWMHGLSQPDGDISFFNDAAFGIASRAVELSTYAARLNISVNRSLIPTTGLVQFKPSGYLRWATKDVVVIMDVAPIGPDYLPGHAHADTLSFELSLSGQRLFVNSGTSCYGVSKERLRQRSTQAHNTVEVDDENSSEVWGGFRVARRARPGNLDICRAGDETIVGCAHNGYCRLPGRVTHHRRWNCKMNEMILTDTLTGEFNQAKARMHFHPDVKVHKKEENHFIAALADGKIAEIFIFGADSSFLEESTWHPEFGLSISNKCLVSQFSSHEVVTKINW